MSILQKLTEGVQNRDMQAEGQALLNKWEATGLLEGLNEGSQKQGMAVLLENQAKELLREASTIGAGDVEGFAAVAFPIVRRVFGGLIANDLVSVQPMSLPSGLIFFLDFLHSNARGGAGQDASIYGGNIVGRQITGGVDLAASGSAAEGANVAGGFYDFGHAHSATTASAGLVAFEAVDGDVPGVATVTNVLVSALTEDQKKAIRYDADILAKPTARVTVLQMDVNIDAAASELTNLDKGKLTAITATGSMGTTLVRRLTRLEPANGGGERLICTFVDTTGASLTVPHDLSISHPIKDNITAGLSSDAAGSVVGQSPFNLEAQTDISEIDIKVDSIAVTAQTKKLKAKWSPELGQDLNAYHNLDAEVELTGILSEQIALEIDRELLNELVDGATAGTRYWSRAPGLFVDSNGKELGATSASPDFTGTVSEWYETLIETINDVSAQIHRKTLRGGANFVVCSPEVANILEFTSGFRASVTADQDRGTIGAVRAGSLSKKFDVYVDPYFLRNVLLVGRKGASFLESGFVYAPYVPLQVTPTIFGTEDFVPRKGVMTRYAKKMVRPDMYGLVIVRGLLGEGGAS